MTSSRTRPQRACTVWGGGQLFAFSAVDGSVSHATGLVARSRTEGCGLDIMAPGTCSLVFSDRPPERARFGGDWFELSVDGQQVRGAFLDAHHVMVDGPCRVDDRQQDVRTCGEGTRTLVGVGSMFQDVLLGADLDAAIQERRRWLRELRIPSGLGSATEAALVKCLSTMKTQVYAPEGAIRRRWTTPDRWPHRAMWLWDSVFHAAGWRHLDLELAREMIEAVLDTQGDDGMVSHMMTPDSRSGITQPPVLALGVELVDERAPDDTWIGSVYPGLCRYVQWDLLHRDSDGAGLVEWAIEGNPMCRSGESGMDNSPRFDTATQLDAVDFNAFLACECEVLARFAARLGRHDESAQWLQRYTHLCELINARLWDDDLGFYLDYDVDAEALSPVLSSAGFLPLVCGAPSDAQAERLCRALDDPDLFATAFTAPSIAVRDAAHYQKDMWRGPVWVNINWLIARGLERYGYDTAAAQLRQRTMAEIEKHYLTFGSVFEFYDDRCEVPPPQLLRKGVCDPSRSPLNQALFDYGWSCTLYVDMVLGGRVEGLRG